MRLQHGSSKLSDYNNAQLTIIRLQQCSSKLCDYDHVAHNYQFITMKIQFIKLFYWTKTVKLMGAEILDCKAWFCKSVDFFPQRTEIFTRIMMILEPNKKKSQNGNFFVLSLWLGAA